MVTFAYPYILFLLLLVPVVACLYILARIDRKNKLKKFGEIRMLKPLMPLVSPYKPAVQLVFELLAITFIVIAMARPWGGVKDEKSEKEGIEVMLAVDASNSMLAPAGSSENGPDRMRTAKLILEKIINRLDNDRVGLIVYAGGAYTLVPVTSDYVSAKQFLNSIDPSQISNQGTNIAEAVSLASRSFTDDKNIGKAIILVTDAEDLEDKEGVMNSVKTAAKNHIQVDVVGIGGTTPVRIPMDGSYVRDMETGEIVETSLNEDLAMEIAEKGKGIYVNASNSGAVNELEKQLDTVKKSTLETNSYVVHDELFSIFVWFALVCIIIRLLILDRRISWLDKISFFNRSSVIIILVGSSFFISQPAFAKDDEVVSTRKERQFINKGNKLYSDADYSKAAKMYEDALRENPESKTALYNLGLTNVFRAQTANSDSLKNNYIQSAMQCFTTVGQFGSKNPELASKAFFNMGNIAFNSQNYKEAIMNYKQALRLNPSYDNARRNLRIAQLKQQQNDNNKDNKQNQQDKKDQEDKQDKNKDNNQDQQQNQQQDQQKPQNKNQINPQVADQILKSMENKENSTRARVSGRGDKSSGQGSSRKKW